MSYPTVKLGSTRVPWPVLSACLIAAPLLAVVGLRALAHRQGISTARGADDLAAGQFVQPTAPKPSAESAALQMTIEMECSQPFGPSPMVNKAPPKPAAPKEPVVVATAPEEKPAPPAPPPPVKPPPLTLTSIMGNTASPVAIINGKVRKVGDSVGSGFKVASIDSVTGSVEISNDDGVQTTLQLKNLHGGE
jgi:hypothetical protein